MADALALPSDLAAQIQGLLAQFQPSEAQQAAARKQAIIAASLGLLGTQKGHEMQALGRSGLLGMETYGNTLENQQKLTAQNMQMAMPLIQMARQQAYADQFSKALNAPAPTMNGPTAPFQAQGGADALMNGGASGQPAPTNSLPTQVPDQAAAQSQRDALANMNISGHLMGMPDMSGALKFKYPDPIALRPNAAIYTPGQGISRTVPVAPPGFSYDFASNSFIPVSNGVQAEARAAAIPKAVGLAYDQQTGVLPGGGTGVVGNKLDTTFPNGQYPFLQGLTTGTQSQPGAAPAPVPSAPVQTKLSPEQTKNSQALGDDLSSYREQVSKSSNALAQLDEISSALTYFKPGPTLPMRAKAAGYAQEIPLVGRSLADSLVPNSAAALPAIAAMEKIGVGLTAEQSKVFGSREGQQVIGMIKSAMPNAEMVPGAPQIIVDAMKGAHQWSIDKGVAAQAWVKDPAHHGSLDGFSTVWDTTHPVSAYVKNLPALAAIARGMPPTAVDQPTVPQQAPGKTVVRTGTFNGQRVVQYSDGTVAPAQ